MASDTDNEPNEAERSRKFWDAQVRDQRYSAVDGPGMLLFDSRLVEIRRRREEAIVQRLLLDPFQRTDVRILDAGCGTGRWSFWFADRGATVIGTDFSGEMIGRCLERQQVIKQQGLTVADRIAFRQQNLWDVQDEAGFDVIFCGGVLQCVSDDELKQFAERVVPLLKTGGLLLTRDSVLRRRVDLSGNFPVHYRRDTEYADIFSQHGLTRLCSTRAWIQPQLVTRIPQWFPLKGKPLELIADADGWLLTHPPLRWLLPVYRKVTGRGIGAVPDHRFFLYQRNRET